MQRDVLRVVHTEDDVAVVDERLLSGNDLVAGHDDVFRAGDLEGVSLPVGDGVAADQDVVGPAPLGGLVAEFAGHEASAFFAAI